MNSNLVLLVPPQQDNGLSLVICFSSYALKRLQGKHEKTNCSE